MLPNKYHPHDAKWIKEQLDKLPEDVALDTCGKYSAVYQMAYDDEPIGHIKPSTARRAANIRLREFVEKYLAWR